MLDYISMNKEWIFSGIGVSVIALLFICFKHFRRNSSQDRTPVTKEANSKSVVAAPEGDVRQEDVYRIIKDIENMPPLHLDDIRRNYIGLKVDWLTEYYSAYTIKDDLIHIDLTLLTKSLRPISVFCEVRLSEYKHFSILKRGAKVRVVGEISKFASYSFGISNVRLFFQ